MNNENNSLQSFIEGVSSSNLETFHSKAIAWTLNQLDSKAALFTGFLKMFKVESQGSIEHLGTVAEKSNHDLITLIQSEKDFHVIIWENKINADFSHKKVDQLPKKDKKKNGHTHELLEMYDQNWKRGISQPYWYQIRWLLWKNEDENLNSFKKTISEELKKITTSTNSTKTVDLAAIEDKHIHFHWLILSPFTKQELEIFHKSSWEGNELNIDPNIIKTIKEVPVIRGDKELLAELERTLGYSVGDWCYVAYPNNANAQITIFNGDLNIENDHLENQVLKSYIDYLEQKDFRERKLSEQNKIGFWTLEKLLELHKKLNLYNEELDLDFEWSISGSQNGSDPLLNIRFKAPLAFHQVFSKENYNWAKIFTPKSKDHVKNSLIDFVHWTLQIQGSIKLQFAHAAYDQVTLVSEESAKDYAKDYANIITETILNIANSEFNSRDEIELREGKNNQQKRRMLTASKIINYNGNDSHFEIKKENLPKTKTALSYTIDINDVIGPIDSVIEICRNIQNFLLDVQSKE